MPTAAPRVCGCPTLPCTGACLKRKTEERKQYDDARGTATQRGYDVAWRRFVKAFRAGYDLDSTDPDWARKLWARNACSVCHVSQGLHYDHIMPLKDGGPRLDPTNVQPLCQRHHNEKTWLERNKSN